MLPFRSPINDALYTSVIDVYTLQSVIFNSACHGQISVDEVGYDEEPGYKARAESPPGLGATHFGKILFPLDLAVARPDLNLLRTMKNE